MNDKVYNYFKDRFKLIPSTLEYKNVKKEISAKILSKSHLIFVTKVVIDNEIVEIDKLVEYDSSGILIYVEHLFKTSDNIFILTTSDRLNVAEFTLHNLIKQNK